MPLPSFQELFSQVSQRARPVSVVAAGGADATVLDALFQASQRGWVQPIVTGNQSDIEKMAAENQIDLASFKVIDSSEPAQAAVEKIQNKQAEVLMKGQIDTPSLMRTVFHHGLQTSKTVCQMVLMEITRDNRIFLLSDTGITIAPTFEQKKEIVEHAISTAKHLGEAVPKIAMMAATEKVNLAMPETEEANQLQQLAEEGSLNSGEATDYAVQGPLSFDLAYANVAGDRKQIAGSVVGKADGMIFPNLLAANLVVKAIMYTADCQFGGVLCGTKVPVVFMSRADSVETRLNSLALALSLISD